MKDVISIVVPCYNEEETVSAFFSAVEEAVKEIKEVDVKYLFVNDGSKDNTLTKLKALEQEYPDKVNYLSFSRNFGKESALYAGLEHATGDYVTVMDADLQDPPSLLPEMYALLQSGAYDCIGTRRVSREGEPKIRSYFAKKFYKIYNKLSDVEIVDGARDFRLMTRQMVDAILELKEYNRFSKGLFSWVGFETYYLEYENIEREEGNSSWSFWQLVSYSLDGIVAFSIAPLAFAAIVGMLSFVVACVSLIFIVVRALLFGDPTSGWPSMVSIILALGGLQLFCLGILGQYLGKTFLETKQRPIYILRESSMPRPKKDLDK